MKLYMILYKRFLWIAVYMFPVLGFSYISFCLWDSKTCILHSRTNKKLYVFPEKNYT